MSHKFNFYFSLSILLVCSASTGIILWIEIQQTHIKDDIVHIKDGIVHIKNDLVKVERNASIKLDAALQAFMAEKVEYLTKDKHSDEEKVIAIAAWISSHISNRHREANQLSDSAVLFADQDIDAISIPNKIYCYFSQRSGACGARSSIMVEMLKYLNIQAKFYNICCFPEKENAHSNVEVYYDNRWHYFDVTYAGYFKKKWILSFEELMTLVKNNEDYLQYMIVFPDTLDHCNHKKESKVMLKKACNQNRMESAYARKKLLHTTQYGNFSCNQVSSCPALTSSE